MAKVRISDLTAAGALAGTDTFPVVQSGVTKKASLSDVLTAVSPSDVGLLSARPAFASVPTGTLYTATDEEGGTTYVNTGSAWLTIARASTITAGEELAAAAPSANTSSVTINASSTPFRLVELTTASFTMPDRPVRVETSGLVLQVATTAGFVGVASGDPRSTVQIRYTKNGWTTSALADARTATFALTGVESCLPMNAMIPPVGGSISLAAGDTVQVAVCVQRSDTTFDANGFYSAASGVFPWIKAIAG